MIETQDTHFARQRNRRQSRLLDIAHEAECRRKDALAPRFSDGSPRLHWVHSTRAELERAKQRLRAAAKDVGRRGARLSLGRAEVGRLIARENSLARSKALEKEAAREVVCYRKRLAMIAEQFPQAGVLYPLADEGLLVAAKGRLTAARRDVALQTVSFRRAHHPCFTRTRFRAARAPRRSRRASRARSVTRAGPSSDAPPSPQPDRAAAPGVLA
jgi:hypothetical protein